MTQFFPDKEPLKFFIREKSCQILEDCFLLLSDMRTDSEIEKRKEAKQNILKNVDILKSYFEIIDKQNLGERKELIVLEGRYNNIRDFMRNVEIKLSHKKEEAISITLRPIKDNNKEVKIERKKENYPEISFKVLKNDRTEKILKILRSREKTRIGELKNIFPQTSKRTLRRDFEFLLNKGLVERIGEGKYTFYKIRS